MAYSSVLTLQDLNVFYSKEDYIKVTSKKVEVSTELKQKVSRAAVEYLIVLEQPDDYIMKQVSSKLEKDSKFLEKTNNPYQLPLLSLAILMNRITLVSKLLDAGANLEQRDKFGWLPIHHAALASHELFQFIVSKTKGDVLTKKTLLGGICEHLRMYAGLAENSKSLQKLQIELETGKKVPFNVKEHLAMFGMTQYTDGPFYPPENLKALWMQTKSEETPEELDKILEAMLEKVMKNPTKLLIKTSEICKDMPRNWGLFADEDLPIGTGTVTYGGKYFGLPTNDTLLNVLEGKPVSYPYVLIDVDAETIGNGGRFANEGFPNCANATVNNVNGLTNIHLIYIIKEGGVKKGEELFWDYGQGEAKLKWNSLYRIPNSAEMREFVKKNTIKDVESKMIALNDPKAKKRNIKTHHILHHTAYGDQCRIVYCVFTPAATLDLWCNEIITAKNWFKQINESRMLKYIIPAQHNKMTRITNVFIQRLMKLEDKLAKSKELNKSVRKFLFNLISKYTMLEVSEMIDLIFEWLNKSNGEDWEKFSEDLISDYPHVEDRDVRLFSILKPFI